jgi:hypothetical protein
MTGRRFFHAFEAFSHPAYAGRQSRFGMLALGDFDATLGNAAATSQIVLKFHVAERAGLWATRRSRHIYD